MEINHFSYTDTKLIQCESIGMIRTGGTLEIIQDYKFELDEENDLEVFLDETVHHVEEDTDIVKASYKTIFTIDEEVKGNVTIDKIQSNEELVEFLLMPALSLASLLFSQITNQMFSVPIILPAVFKGKIED